MRVQEDAVLHAHQLLDAEVFAVDKLTVRMADGSIAARHVVRHPGTVAVIAENDEHLVALVRVYRAAVGGHRWELPAGHVPPGMDALSVAAAELRSEVGQEANRLDVECEFLNAPGHSDHRTVIVRARHLTSVPPTGRTSDEASLQVRWCTPEEASALASLDGPVDAKTLIALNILVSGTSLPCTRAAYEHLRVEELIGLYATTNDRFIADNATIWTTGAIFVPAAYAAPVVFFSLERQTWAAFLGLSFVSVILALGWLFIAEKQKVFQTAHMDRSEALEQMLGIPPSRKRSDLRWAPARMLVERVSAGVLRRLLAVGVIGAWVAIGIGRAVS